MASKQGQTDPGLFRLSELFPGHTPTVTMVTILNVYLVHSHPRLVVSLWLHRRHWFIESSCRLRRLALCGIVFFSQRSNRASVSPVSRGTCRIEQVPYRDSVHLVTFQLSRFKVVQCIGLKRQLMSVDSYEIAQYVVECICCRRVCVIRPFTAFISFLVSSTLFYGTKRKL